MPEVGLEETYSATRRSRRASVVADSAASIKSESEVCMLGGRLSSLEGLSW